MTWTVDLGHGREFCLDLALTVDIRERWIGN